MRNKLYLVLIFFAFITCKEEKKDDPKKNKVVTINTKKNRIAPPEFNQDSAYYFIQKQVDFGPRVPNTEAHKNCAKWLSSKLENYGANVIIQKGVVTAFNGTKLNIQNIIAQFQPEKKERIMLFAHWDTRPVADRDTKDKYKPIDGANDGGSGTGVLLEIARLMQNKPTSLGIDIIFFDAEDYGEFSGDMNMMAGSAEDSWCLGTQYWAKNPPVKNYMPKYGILLDMVGAKEAKFPKEAGSIYYAPDVVEKVWRAAKNIGYGTYFINEKMAEGHPGITDDHKYVYIMAKIPCIDIIQYDLKRGYGGDFGHFHHTHKDNMEIIDKNTLKAVGQTVLEVIYNE